MFSLNHNTQANTSISIQPYHYIYKHNTSQVSKKILIPVMKNPQVGHTHAPSFRQIVN
jgi:GH25 family lysozyme M1 (1,4-beta-N-acetylmuramidase)